MGALRGGRRKGHDHLASRRHHRHGKGEEGFTLIELLIVLVILPLVVGAIAMVLITTLKNDQGVQGTVADSSAATLSSSYYVRDVESAGAVTTFSTASSPVPCSAVGLAGSTTFLLGLQLQGTSPAALVSYYIWTPTPNGPPEFVREYCSGSSTPQSHEILSDNLSATNLPTPELSCISPTPTSIPAGVACPPTMPVDGGWTPTYLVASMSLNVTQGCSNPATSCGPYQYDLTGDPQSGVPIPPINQPCGVLTLLSPQTDIDLGANVFGSELLSVQGPIVLNSGYNTSGNAAITSNLPLGSQDVSATGLTSCPDGGSVPDADAIGVYNCNNTSSSGVTTNYTQCPTGGQHTAVNSVTVSPNPPVQISTGPNQNGIPDPLLAWASEYTLPTVSPVTCPQSSHMNCPPGLYSSGLTIPNNATVTFQAGNYEFGGTVSCPGTSTSLCIQNSDTVNFGGGQYTFTNGIDVSGSGSTLSGTGVLFYVKAGKTYLGNYLASNTVQLSACTANCSISASQNVVLWQDIGDNNQVVLSSPNSANATNTLAGEIYAPSAQVFINGYGGNVATQDIVAFTLAFGGTGLNSLGLTVSPIP